MGLSVVQKSSRMNFGFNYGETPKGNHRDFLPQNPQGWRLGLPVVQTPEDDGCSSRLCTLQQDPWSPRSPAGLCSFPLPCPGTRGCFPPSSPSIPWKRALRVRAPGKLHNFPQGCRHRIWFCVHPAQPGLALQLRLRFVPCVRTVIYKK